MPLIEEFDKQGNWLFRYRGELPLIVVLIGYVLYARTEFYPETFFLEETVYEPYYEAGCLLISLLGLFIRIYTVGHTPENTSGRNTEKQVADSLNTTGAYSLVRHPLYLGNFFMSLGPVLLTGNFSFLIIFCLLFWVYYERIMFAEENFLRKKFGEHYIEWAQNIPPFLPRHTRKKFLRPQYKFSWKKVIKKEKNGLVAIFLIFSIFDITGEILEGRRDFNYVFIFLCIATIIAYFIIKYIKSRMTTLNESQR